MSAYKLTLHKKSYLLTGIKKDDSNKEKVKQLGAKWNGSLGGWLFFPDKHKEGLKFAKEIGAEIDEKIKEEKSPKKESKEKVEKNKCECCEKYKSEIEKLKQELAKVQDKCDRMGDVLGENGLGISDDENDESEVKARRELEKLASKVYQDDINKYDTKKQKIEKHGLKKCSDCGEFSKLFDNGLCAECSPVEEDDE